ncbi:MAG: hypothetical protein AAFR61_15855 [Bacteroidota bacterium]
MGNQDQLKGLLSEQFAHFEAEPDQNLWPLIEAEIKPAKKTVLPWWSYAAVAASAVILVSLFFLLQGNPDGEQPMAEEQQFPQVETPTSTQQEMQEGPAFTEESTPQEKPNPERRSVPQVQEQSTFQPLFASQTQPAQTQEEVQTSADRPRPQPAREAKKENEIGNFTPLAVTVPPSFEANPLTQQPDMSPSQTRMAPKAAITNNKLDLNNLSLDGVLTFASNLERSPIDVYKEKDQNGEVKVYQLDLFNLKITRKSHKRRVKRVGS